ncbi:BsuPI-related putative proteinase inhibitor [Pseudobacteroides cellulosolvens]|uniref:Intracellular proteinase inhibitor n=1 Tax=Pseudobacteroides cellulosolvens ATCC 35603 = DSM 2933 TaxID=398512 RepID=A0A0L6JIZ5_9FIRM|nr:BsuPI-related putative proteinase inhibitor [Pseudobacteroides cellulosolvens]KNY25836.1 Intracellular proteinase inhibitor [Pseudobacteroides cellulosolvens ATCC 35603 = DSM 2933]
MRKKLLGSTILLLTLSSSLMFTSYGQTKNIQPISSGNKVVVSGKQIKHWSQTYIDQLSKNHDAQSLFKGKDLNSIVKADTFKNIVSLVFDAEYDSTSQTLTREAVVYELMKIWSQKTGQDLDKIPTIKMILYSDMGKINAKYHQAITAAYMKNIAKGRGGRIFDPKTGITYGELAALVFNTSEAIRKEVKPDVKPIAKGRFETRGNYEIKDGNVVFNFELMSHYTEPQKLMFGSGQMFEVSVTDEKGKEVYRFSDGKFFTLALVSKTINPGEALKWQNKWDMTDKDGKKLTSGKYRAEIIVMASPEENGETIDKNHLTTVIEFELTDDVNKDIIKPELAEKIIKDTSDKLINAISTKDAESISQLTHPVKGVRFTPYTNVSLKNDLVFKKEDIKNFFNDEKVYLWGSYDGSGDEISLTPGKYYEKFIYPVDYKNAEQVGYNKVLSSGNMIENQFEVYDNPIVVEYYFSGFNPDYEGMDWKSLRLVFEQYEGTWYLSGIIHNQWTI